MSDKSAIEWTEATWNPLVGCDRISPGCAHCYAKAQHDRRHKAFLAGKQMPIQYAKPFEVVQLRPDRLEQPLRWRKARRIFVNSLSDLFHPDVPDAFIDRVFAVMALCPQHTFQVLTKRADRMRAYFGVDRYELIERVETQLWEMHTDDTTNAVGSWPLPNVWLGGSVENQHFADERIPLLLQTPAAVRFISAEPLLGPVDLTSIPVAMWRHHPSGTREQVRVNALRSVEYFVDEGSIEWPALDWVIVGGESGPGARPFDLGWARSIIAECRAAGVAVFMKQIGVNPRFDLSRDDTSRLLIRGDHFVCRDKKGGDIDEFPEDLRIREWPRSDMIDLAGKTTGESLGS